MAKIYGNVTTTPIDPDVLQLKASNIYFTEDLRITQSFGKYVPDTTTGMVTIPTATDNMSVQDLFMKAYSEELAPPTPEPKAVINTSTSNYEIGTKVTPGYSVSFDTGEYKYGPATQIGETATWTITSNKGGNYTTTEGTFDEITVTNGECFYCYATVAWEDDTVMPITNFGNECPGAQIKSGSHEASKLLIQGYMPNFYGFTTEDDVIDIGDVDSGWIRTNLFNQGSTTSMVKSHTANESWMQFFYAMPKGRKSSISAKSGNGLPLTVETKEVTIKHVGDVESQYTVFYINNDMPHGPTTLTLT